MSATPQDRINARAQLEFVARRLYADPTAALRTMRHDAHVYGAEAVSRNLQQNFIQYGEPAPDLHGPKLARAQEALREGGVAADVERWLVIDHSPPQQQMVADTSIESVLRAPDAEALGRDPAEWDRRSSAYDLNPDERLAYEQLEAYGAAREREAKRLEAEARLHSIKDHRDYLLAAEESLPEATAALRKDVETTYSDREPSFLERRRGISKGTSAMETIEEAIKQDGPAETARRIRSGELLGKQQRPINSRKAFRRSARRDPVAELERRERVATRIQTVGYCQGDLGKWSTFTPAHGGPPVTGAENVRAALALEEAKVLSDNDLGPLKKEIARNRPAPPHPSVEASRLKTVAQRHLDRLSPESRERVARVAQRSGADRVTAALGHLQTIHMAARSLREGVEPPGM